MEFMLDAQGKPMGQKLRFAMGTGRGQQAREVIPSTSDNEFM
jgi:hypothetical protein